MFRKKVRPHADEFRKTWFGARSRRGFRIELRRMYWIDYFDDRRNCSIFFEPMGLKHGLIVHAGDRRGFETIGPDETAEILGNIRRALEFCLWEVDWVD